MASAGDGSFFMLPENIFIKYVKIRHKNLRNYLIMSLKQTSKLKALMAERAWEGKHQKGLWFNAIKSIL
jgi:hypothetical protein